MRSHDSTPIPAPAMSDHRTVLVTGATGRIGSQVVRELRQHGLTVIPVDRANGPGSGVILVDLADFDALDSVIAAHSIDAIVHLAGMPGRTQVAGNQIFANNMLASYHVFAAARKHRVRHLIYASSETILGLPFTEPPAYLPVDEEVPNRFTSDYGLVKDLEERMAGHLALWCPQMTIIGLLLATVITPDAYEQFRTFRDEPESRRYNLWSYVDVRDVGQAVRRALGFEARGFERFIVAAADSVLDEESEQLARKNFGEVARTRALHGNESLFSIDKSRRLLGYEPQYSWRSLVPA